MVTPVETVKSMYAAFGRGDVAGILAHCAADIEWEHDWGGEPLKWYRPRRGHDGVLAFLADLADFEFLRFEPVAFMEGDGRVAALIQLELKVKANGRLIRDLEMHLWTFGADGKVTRLRHLCDTHQFALATA